MPVAGIELPHAEPRRLLRQREPRRGVGQRLHALPLVVDVDDRAAHQHDVAVDFRDAVLLRGATSTMPSGYRVRYST